MERKGLRALIMIGIALLLAAITIAAQPAPQGTQPPSPTPDPKVMGNFVPFFMDWAGSGHAKTDAEAFTHWNEATPPEIPVECAKCHSSPGFQDYVGADGSAPFKVDKKAPVGSVITCITCHNKGTLALSSVKFPSGAEIKNLGREAVCMTCHQGNASMVSVDDAIKKANSKDDDTVVAELGFVNIHYFAASVARYGTLVKGGYEYSGKAYDAVWQHAAGINTCIDCHNSHTLEIKLETCKGCHTGVSRVEDIRSIRMMSSSRDYDGDGNVKEGIAAEVDGVRAMLLAAIQAYATEVAKSPIAYDAASYPYFFIDKNSNGKVDKDEAAVPNKYVSFTPRLLKAAYNYQTSIKDPGAYVHGGKYIIQLLYDSIEDLNTKLAKPVDLAKAHRDDPGHFLGAAMAFRDWDAEGEVPGRCAKCHSGSGLATFAKEGVNVSAPTSDGLLCEDCHNDLTKFTRYAFKTVTFPSGASLTFGDDKVDDNLCINCHQGRESTVSVQKAVKGLEPDKVSEKLAFRNVHYFAAGATIFGTEAKGMFEYPDKTYAGKFNHEGKLNTCSSCHDAHVLSPKTDTCKGCHQVDDPSAIRMTSKDDYDGDGDAKEGLKGEVDGLSATLYAVIQAYGKTVAGSPIAYDPNAYPYFFVDTNGDGKLTADEAKPENAYKSWTPRLVEATYNYQFAQKDPGAFVHNAKYVMQVLIDSIEDLNTQAKAKVPTFVRP